VNKGKKKIQGTGLRSRVLPLLPISGESLY
jgi:hypothetical protein